MLHLQMIGFRAQGCARAVVKRKQNGGMLRYRECGASSPALERDQFWIGFCVGASARKESLEY
jgi:hypothetical protein